MLIDSDSITRGVAGAVYPQLENCCPRDSNIP